MYALMHIQSTIQTIFQRNREPFTPAKSNDALEPCQSYVLGDHLLDFPRHAEDRIGVY